MCMQTEEVGVILLTNTFCTEWYIHYSKAVFCHKVLFILSLEFILIKSICLLIGLDTHATSPPRRHLGEMAGRFPAFLECYSDYVTCLNNLNIIYIIYICEIKLDKLGPVKIRY